MSNLISKTELEAQKKTSKKDEIRYVGQIYPEIFTHSKNFVFKEDMPFESAILYLGAYQLKNELFPRLKCPICGKEEVLIPYMCGGSVLSGCHTIQFYCLNCKEQFVTNDDIEYFRKIYRYVIKHREELKPSPAFRSCTSLPASSIIV